MTEAEKPLVRRLFQERDPNLARMLNNTGGFWPRVLNNSLTAGELATTIYLVEGVGGRTDSAVAGASHLLFELRGENLLSTPPEVSGESK